MPEGTIVISTQDNWKDLLQTLSQLYLNGAEIDWKGFDRPYYRKKVILPTYPFQREKYWAETFKIKKGRHLQKDSHPLLGELILSPSEEKLFRNELDLSFLPYLADHQIFEHIFFPGAGFAELFHAVGNKFFKDRPFTIANLVIEQPLYLNAGKETLLEVLVKPKEGGYKASIYSIEKENWVMHAVSDLSALETIPTVNFEWDRLSSICQKSINPDDLYKNFDAIGLHYGKQFQTLQSIKIGDNELIAELEGEASPAILDGCWQAVFALIQKEGEQKNVYLPLSINRLICFGELGTSVRIHIHQMQIKDNNISADISIFSYEGMPLMKIEGFRARKTDQAHLQQMLAKQTSLGINSLFYQITWQPKPLEKTGKELKGSWLIVSEGKEEVQGIQAKIVKPEQATSELKENGIIWFISGKDALKHALAFVQNASQLETKPQIFFITRGIQPVGPITDLDNASFNGFYKTVKLELPALDCRHIDLGANDKLPLQELVAADQEEQVTYYEGVRYVPRLLLARDVKRSGKKLLIPIAQAFQLETSSKGALENLYLRPKDAISAPGPNEITIAVKAAGLNFRDVLNALGLYPGDPGPLGSEYAGIVTAIGEEVSEFKIGDPVVGFAQGCFASHATVSKEMAVLMPPNLSFLQAAAIPIVFSTAYYALITLAKLKSGDKVLIHAAAGGVGLAAIQIAQQFGAEIYATASSPEKYAYLQSLGVSHIYNSRTLDFAEEIMRDTTGEGINVVLNSLTGEGFVAKTVSTCRQGARFVEIGKRNIWSKEDMQKVRPDINYFILALDDLMVQQPQEVNKVLSIVIGQFGNNKLKPLHSVNFDISDARRCI